MTKASLLASESTGGATARGGFAYQDAFVLQNMPLWLSQGAFSHVVSEALGDVEICYFGEDGTIVRTFIEAKEYALSWGDFWSEIRQFKNVHETSPAEFPRFALVCRDFNERTAPLVSRVSRLRGVGSSYDAASPLLAQTREEIVAWVVGKGGAAELAQFVVDRVEFVTYADENASAAFPGELERHLRPLNLRASEAATFRERCSSMVTRSARGPVKRAEIEAALTEVQGPAAPHWTKAPTDLWLNGSPSPYELAVPVDAFNGPQRAALHQEDWTLLAERLAAVGRFVKQSRQRPCIALSSKQRMSLACLLGYTFAATKGYTLDIEHNGSHFRTDDHAQATGQFFANAAPMDSAVGREGVAVIAFPTRAGTDVDTAIGDSLLEAPRLSLHSDRPINSPATLNKAVAEAKGALTAFRASRQLEVIHLFIKAPSHFATALGHRLNGVGRLQLYDWVDGRYVPTTQLG